MRPSSRAARFVWLAIAIASPVPARATLAILTVRMQSAQVGMPYAQMVRAGGGSGPYLFAVEGLPAGLSSMTVGTDAVLVSGEPTEIGRFPVTVRVTSSDEHVSQRYWLLVEGSALAIDGPDFPAAIVGRPYVATVRANRTASFSIQTGTLPPGLDLAPDGSISGTPQGPPGESRFLVRATAGHEVALADAYILVTENEGTGGSGDVEEGGTGGDHARHATAPAGCSSSGADGTWLSVLLILSALLQGPRRRPSSA